MARNRTGLAAFPMKGECDGNEKRCTDGAVLRQELEVLQDRSKGRFKLYVRQTSHCPSPSLYPYLLLLTVPLFPFMHCAAPARTLSPPYTGY